MKTNATIVELQRALEAVNNEHGYKLTFNRLEQKGRSVHFTIKSDSGIPGARTSPRGRNLACASWHAHGYLFDELFSINPNAIVWSLGRKITAIEGNWEDSRIAGPMHPGIQWYSQASIL